MLSLRTCPLARCGLPSLRSMHSSRLVQAKESTEEYTFNINNILMKEHENKSLTEVLTLPPSALEGLTPASDEILKKFKIMTVEDLGNWRAHKLAQAVVSLAMYEEDATEDGKKGRKNEAQSNLFAAFDKEYRALSLKEISDTPPHSIKGFAPWVDEEFLHLSSKLKSIEAFAAWKYPSIAAHLCTLASFEDK